MKTSITFLALLSYFGVFCQKLNPEKITPIFKTELPVPILESSGIIEIDNTFWTHNDSGNESELYQIDKQSGELLKTIAIPNVKNRDWEEISQDENYIYIGDFGNNNGNRTNLKIYRILKSELKIEKITTVDSIEFSYKNQSSFDIRNRANDWDCEAMFCIRDSIYLLSKNWINKKTYLYAMPKSIGKYELTAIDSFDTQALVSAAHYDENKQQLLVLGYSFGTKNETLLWIFNDFKSQLLSLINPSFFKLKIQNFQAEAIVKTSDSLVYITTEKLLSFKPKLFAFDINKSIIIQEFISNLNVYPNPTSDTITIDVPDYSDNIKFALFDINGKQINKFTAKPNSQKHISLNSINSGMYFFKILNSGFDYSHKIMVTN